MASVQEVGVCPQCGKRAFVEVYTHTLAAEVFCPCCGYCEHTRPVAPRRNRHGSHKVRQNGERVYRTTKHVGWGAYCLRRRNGVSILGALRRPLTANVKRRFQRELKRPGVDLSESYLTRWDPKRKRIQMVVGKFPRDLP